MPTKMRKRECPSLVDSEYHFRISDIQLSKSYEIREFCS